MLRKAVEPPRIRPSTLGFESPAQRAADLPEIVSIGVNDLFPEIPEPLYFTEEDTPSLRKAVEQALSGVDMSMIKPDDSVNVLCTEHGFSMLDGVPYAEIVKTIKDVVQTRTGCENVRLRLGTGISRSEARDLIRDFDLHSYFNKRTAGFSPFDRGVAIETEIGTLYGIAKAYDADWFIHVAYDDPRELHFHRYLYRLLKAFTMGYARAETRSIYHFQFGNRSANIIPRAIFESDFVQEKFAFMCVMKTTPRGIAGVDADNDIKPLNERMVKTAIRHYGKMITLFCEIDALIPLMDCMKWAWYQHAGGISFVNSLKGPADFFDLEVGSPQKPIPAANNPAIKAMVVNYTWRGTPDAFWGMNEWFPIILCPNISRGMVGSLKGYVQAENLQDAVDKAKNTAGTDNIMVFDGSFGSINLSPSLAESLLKKAPEVSQKVEEELMPIWLQQRGIDPGAI